MKNATFDISRKILGPVHLHPKKDKWDYLPSPIIESFFVSCFDVGEVPRRPGKWNWNWLYFFAFHFHFRTMCSACKKIDFSLQDHSFRFKLAYSG